MRKPILVSVAQTRACKIKDGKGNWYNIELTCQSILSDAHYTNNSYIKANALRNKIYLEPLGKEQIIAYQLLGLAQNYYRKYGVDNFYLQCVNKTVQYFPNNVDAIKMQASYYQNMLICAAKLLNKADLQNFGELQKYWTDWKFIIMKLTVWAMRMFPI